MACPICKSDQFYVKDPEDDFGIYEFQLKDGEIAFEDADTEAEADEIGDKREIYCQRCAWHGKKDAL